MERAQGEKIAVMLNEHHTATYRKLMGIETFSGPAAPALQAGDYRRAHVRITSNFRIIHDTESPNRNKTIAAFFKVAYDGTSCIYAVLYSKATGSTAQHPGGGFEHSRVCTSPTYKSQDGEYRQCFITWNDFINSAEKYGRDLAAVDGMVTAQLAGGRLGFQTDICYPEGTPVDRRAYELSINADRLPIKLYINCWAIDAHRIHTKTIENHISPAYQHILYGDESAAICDALTESHGEQWRRSMLRSMRNGRQVMRFGCKLAPMTLGETLNTGHIDQPIWRELYAMTLCADLGLNMICDSFPYIVGWYYIYNTHAAVYDNLAMHEKYAHSDTARDITNQLRAADDLSYYSSREDGLHKTEKFAQLSQRVAQSARYAADYISLSSVSICIVTEWVGRTLRDLPVSINSTLLSHAEPTTGAFFDYIYAMYCMNVKRHMIHSDLHMNNVTLNPNAFSVNPAEEAYAYVVQSDVYVLPACNLRGMVIDFSRVLLGDTRALADKFGEVAAINYIDTQKRRAIRIIAHYLPKYYKGRRAALDKLAADSYPLFFKILSAVDAYALATNTLVMVEGDAYYRGEGHAVSESVARMLTSIAEHAEALMIRAFDDALAGKIMTPEDIEWPNQTILRHVYGQYICMGVSTRRIVVIYDSTRHISYSTEDNVGPLLDKTLETRLTAEFSIPMAPSAEYDASPTAPVGQSSDNNWMYS